MTRLAAPAASYSRLMTKGRPIAGQAAAGKSYANTLSGFDIVDEVVRLCGMNFYLHGIGDGDSPV